jgi:hypothetical protein
MILVSYCPVIFMISSCLNVSTSFCYLSFLNISLTVRSVRLTVFDYRPSVIFRPFYTLFLFPDNRVYYNIKSFIEFKLLRDLFLSFFLSFFPSAIVFI